jgi:hypothetical protein
MFNLRHAINEYGLLENSLALQIVAQTNSSGGNTSGGGSTSGGTTGGYTTVDGHVGGCTGGCGGGTTCEFADDDDDDTIKYSIRYTGGDCTVAIGPNALLHGKRPICDADPDGTLDECPDCYIALAGE